MDKSVIDAMNNQINLEFSSAYIYLAYSIDMEKQNYKGYSEWLLKHAEEEVFHGKDFLAFLQKRNAVATLQDVKAENLSAKNPLEVAQAILAHEQKVTASIYAIHDTAKKAGDYATEIFMHEYIREQIEEEDLAQEIVDKFALAGDDMAARYYVDSELRNL